MIRYVLKRIGLALITLVLLSVIVFAISTILPGNVGRAVLGPFATQESVDALNEQLGTVRPQLAADLERLAKASIPVDVSFTQGKSVLGLAEAKRQ